MGEFADMFNDQIEDQIEDQMASMELDPYGQEDRESDSSPSPYKACTNCGEGGLLWSHATGKWRLFKEGKPHLCPRRPTPPDIEKWMEENTYCHASCNETQP